MVLKMIIVIDFMGYKATKKRMTPEQYNMYLTRLQDYKHMDFAEKQLNEIVRNCR
jgi:hypothetical protein